jgi:ABC-type Na+ efflux pump permease subunit
MNTLKAIYLASMASWWADKASIKQRLIYWPLGLPAIMVAFIVIALYGMSARTGVNGDFSKQGGVVVAIQGSPYSKQISSLLESKPTAFQTIIVSKDNINKLIKQGEATFGLGIDETSKKLSLTLIYDLERDYVHMKWIKLTEERMVDIAASIRGSRLSGLGISNESINVVLAPITMKVEGFGNKTGTKLLLGLMFIIWSVLLISPLDYAKGLFFKDFIQDRTHDLMPIWLTARASKTQVLCGRVLSSLSVFVLSMSVMCLFMLFWGWLYGVLIEKLLSMGLEKTMLEPEIHPFTLGYLTFLNDISFTGISGVWLFMTIGGATALCGMLGVAITSSSTEQARNKVKIVDFIAFNIPLIGFVIGYSGVNYIIAAIPFVGLYHMTLALLSGDASLSLGLITIGLHVLVAILALKIGRYLLSKPLSLQSLARV